METNKQSSAVNNYEGKDGSHLRDELWIIARKRAAFKRSLLVYLVMNVFFVAIWYFTSGSNSYYWPIWPLIGWGFGIAMQYVAAYHYNSIFTAEREYEKLKNEQIH